MYIEQKKKSTLDYRLHATQWEEPTPTFLWSSLPLHAMSRLMRDAYGR